MRGFDQQIKDIYFTIASFFVSKGEMASLAESVSQSPGAIIYIRLVDRQR